MGEKKKNKGSQNQAGVQAEPKWGKNVQNTLTLFEWMNLRKKQPKEIEKHEENSEGQEEITRGYKLKEESGFDQRTIL